MVSILDGIDRTRWIAVGLVMLLVLIFLGYIWCSFSTEQGSQDDHSSPADSSPPHE